ncbi:MAG: hypothetical protein GY816_11935 [Cytophagales bacterium]|nr:hypothetical protein [Cytophagales bacterium]
MKLEILNRVMLELPDTACQAGGLSYDLKPFSGLGIAIFNTKFGRIGELEVYTSYILERNIYEFSQTQYPANLRRQPAGQHAGLLWKR